MLSAAASATKIPLPALHPTDSSQTQIPPPRSVPVPELHRKHENERLAFLTRPAAVNRDLSSPSKLASNAHSPQRFTILLLCLNPHGLQNTASPHLQTFFRLRYCVETHPGYICGIRSTHRHPPSLCSRARVVAQEQHRLHIDRQSGKANHCHCAPENSLSVDPVVSSSKPPTKQALQHLRPLSRLHRPSIRRKRHTTPPKCPSTPPRPLSPTKTPSATGTKPLPRSLGAQPIRASPIQTLTFPSHRPSKAPRASFASSAIG